jgi:ABC-2 type transport system permease protein
MKGAVRAEWTKLRTESGTAWLLLAVLLVSVGSSIGVLVAAAGSTCAPHCGFDLPRLSLTGLMVGQGAVAILAVLVIGNEYSSGLIRTTLCATPSRMAVLAAKATVLTGVLLAVGAPVVLGSLLAGRLILPDPGFSADPHHPLVSLADGPTLRAAVGSVLYLVLIGLLGLGVATITRDSAAAVGIVLGLLYLFPILIHVVQDPQWQRHLQQIAPMSAGLAVQTTVDVAHLPIGPWAGLGVLAAWAAGALVVGGLVFRLRDA